MATYVVSDVHGHLKALDAALSAAGPSSEDAIYMLGDMGDRGPEPVGVMQLCRNTPNMKVLLGNHEQLMLDAIHNEQDDYAWMMWAINGGATTSQGFVDLKPDEFVTLADWVENLPLHDMVHVGDKTFLLVHAGIRPVTGDVLLDIFDGEEAIPTAWDDYSLERLLNHQTKEDLLWIRGDFWGSPTGLVDANGSGPIVVAGHTPTVMIEQIANSIERPSVSADQCIQMLPVGATEATGGVADKIAIDCGAGSVEKYGRVLVLRLDDMREFYAPVLEGE